MLKKKKKKKKKKVKCVEERETLLIKFWGLLKQNLHENKIDFLDKLVQNRTTTYWFLERSKETIGFVLERNTFRVELYFQTTQIRSNSMQCMKYKEELENSFDGKS